jgi:hypothetical protein
MPLETHNYQCHQSSWVQATPWLTGENPFLVWATKPSQYTSTPIHQYITHQHLQVIAIWSPPGWQVTLHLTLQCTQVVVSHSSLSCFCIELQLLCLQAQGVSPTTVSTNTWLEIPFNTTSRICLLVDGTSSKDKVQNPTVLQNGHWLSPVSPTILTSTIGSEFHSNQLLEPLLQFHPLWKRVKTWWTTGADYLLLPISDDKCQEDLQANLTRGTTSQLSFMQSESKHANRWSQEGLATHST